MNTRPREEARGKIAFIFPARFNSHGANSPTLNFMVKNGRLAMSMGVSFLELNQEENYLVTFTLVDPSGETVVTSNGMDGLPSREIHPEWKTSFLSANFYFDVKEYGTYTFTCQLINPLYDFGNPIDTKEILFNIIDEGAINE
ncbi:hypothetical protein [Serratia bockelmannii]|uniref:hypothetical protein n=1 Tax=Serratia bockelmannii TaxID=2703793 RepID=UPI0011F3DB9E|nr:hypothetical protein [Serratia bockelmannii]